MLPRCTVCQIRPARQHHAVGFWNQCDRCNTNRRRASARWYARHGRLSKSCRAPGCGERGTISGWCSTSCRQEYQVKQRAANKAAVIAALGGACACTVIGCYHSGPCPVRLCEGLTVHHEHDDGHQIRNTTRTGQSASLRPRGPDAWSRYRRALKVPGHGMRLLCGTCHLVHTAHDARAARAQRISAA